MVRAVPVFRERQFRFWFRFLKTGSGGSGSAFGFRFLFGTQLHLLVQGWLDIFTKSLTVKAAYAKLAAK